MSMSRVIMPCDALSRVSLFSRGGRCAPKKVIAAGTDGLAL